MELPKEGLEERLSEINSYLGLLKTIDRKTRSGPPKIAGSDEVITTEQQRILYSSVFLQLYNIVESTVTKCLDLVTSEIFDSDSLIPSELNSKLRRMWVQEIAKTHINLTPQNRLENAVKLCDHLIRQSPVKKFKVKKGAGNWDDTEIERIARQLGCRLEIPEEAQQRAKCLFRNNKNALGFIKSLRNQLAHGEISFAQCSESITIGDLESLTISTSGYLRGVAESFENYVTSRKYLSRSDEESESQGITA